jgi:hypothetical protein
MIYGGANGFALKISARSFSASLLLFVEERPNNFFTSFDDEYAVITTIK